MQIISAPVLVTNDSQSNLLQPGAVAYDNGIIADIGNSNDIIRKYPGAGLIEYDYGILTPGLINLHHHLYSSFARGWNSRKSPKIFPDILKDIWWRLDEALTLEDIYYSAIIGLCDSVLCGVTGVIDHHSSQKTITDSLSEIARAFDTIGIRGSLCFELSDRGGAQAFEDGIRETFMALKRWPLGGGLISTMIGMHASMTLSDSSLARIADIAEKFDVGCHFHLVEDRCDQDDSLSRYSMRVTERMAKYGILGQKSLAIHGIHLSDAEIKLLKDTGTNLAICARSNQNNAVGAARWWNYDGVNIGIGTDGIGSDLINDARAALYIAHHESGDPTVGFADICSMLLNNNPAIFEKVTGARYGQIATGYPADIILWDYNSPTPVTADNIGGHYLYGLSNCRVDSVWIEGKTILSNGIFTEIDYPSLMARSRELAKKLWSRL